MPSPQFRQLFVQCGRADHARLMTAAEIRQGLANEPGKPWPATTPIPWRMAGRLADLLLGAYGNFQEDLERVAVTTRLRRQQLPMLCPVCSEPDCPGAVFVQELSMGALQQFIQTKMAKLHPPESPW